MPSNHAAASESQTVVVISPPQGQDGERLVTEHTEPAHQHPPRDAMLAAQHHVPEGSGPWLGEGKALIAVVSVLAVIGVGGIAAILGPMFGAQAAAIGVVWVLMGYVVAWIVVWGAGLSRVRDEKEVEHRITHPEHATPLPPPLPPPHA